MMLNTMCKQGVGRQMPACLAGLMLAGLIPLAAAQPHMDADTFLQSCRNHENGQAERQNATSPCLAFLQGYVAASREIAPVSERPSPFMLRALGNRAPNLPTVRNILEARYCLPEDFSFGKLASKVVQLSSQPPDSASAAELVATTLEAEFRC